jgi:hypothetical protein
MRFGACEKLAVLEGVPSFTGGPQGPMWYLGEGEGAGVPPGYTDFDFLKTKALNAASGEPDLLNKQTLIQAANIAGAAVGIPMAGTILDIIAGGIRGRTQHVPYAEALTKGRQFGESQRTIYNALPADAQAFMTDKAHEFSDYMFALFGTWWGGVYARIWGQPGTIEQFRSNPGEWIYHVTTTWFHIITASADATTVSEDVKAWFFSNYENIVLKPLNDFMLSKYNETVQQYVDRGGKAITTESAGFGGVIGLLAVAGIGGAILAAKSKRGRR